MKGWACLLLWSTINTAWSLPQILLSETSATRRNFCSPGEDCVDFFLCDNTTSTIKTDGSEIISLRGPSDDDDDDVSEGVECTKEFHVCCKIPGKEIVKGSHAVKTTTPENSVGCGFRNTDGVLDRIIGSDTDTSIGEFPWMIAIFKKNPENSYLAGGSLIHPSVILTSAHNVRKVKAEEIIVNVGKWTIEDEEEVVKHQKRNVLEIRKHPQYRVASYTNDIALLFLIEPVKLGPTVQTICLPPMHFNFNDLEYGEECTVTGWGKNAYGDKELQESLRKIDLPFIGHESCQSLLNTKEGIGDLFKDYTLDKSFICAGGGRGSDACTGDGGSPLICPIEGQPNRYHQIGLVSWGIRCGEIDLPGMYANVPYLKSWIDEQMIEGNYGTSTYTL